MCVLFFLFAVYCRVISPLCCALDFAYWLTDIGHEACLITIEILSRFNLNGIWQSLQKDVLVIKSQSVVANLLSWFDHFDLFFFLIWCSVCRDLNLMLYIDKTIIFNLCFFIDWIIEFHLKINLRLVWIKLIAIQYEILREGTWEPNYLRIQILQPTLF